MGAPKVLLATENAFHAGLGVGSACRQTASSDGVLLARESFPFKQRVQLEIDEMESQTGDGARRVVDEALIVPSSLANIYNFVTYLPDLHSSVGAEGLQNEYLSRFFPRVMKHINNKGLYLLNSSAYSRGGFDLVTCAEGACSTASLGSTDDWSSGKRREYKEYILSKTRRTVCSCSDSCL